MMPFLTDVYGNAASTDHMYGADAARGVQNARDEVAALIGARSDEIIFTSGATESNNLAILGLAESFGVHGGHIITVATEHKAVLDPCAYLQKRGFSITYLAVDADGTLDIDNLRAALTPQTFLISVMTANNEIGTIAPIQAIGRVAKEAGVVFHTDATQAAAYTALDVRLANVDLMSLSAHKMYGPKGVGVLYVRKRSPRIQLSPIIHGGGHERGFRSGTLNVPGIVGMGAAASLCRTSLRADAVRIAELRDELCTTVCGEVPDVKVNGARGQKLPNNLSMTIAGVESRSLLIALREDVAMSVGSACTTATIEASHVLRALGRTDLEAHETVRMSLGRFTAPEESRFVASKLVGAIADLRRLNGTL
jgi:cysteine desulfurase